MPQTKTLPPVVLNRPIKRSTTVVILPDGASTTVNVVRYERRFCTPKIVAFTESTELLTWCRLQGVKEAVSGGFFLRDAQQILGDAWIGGRQQASTPIVRPWHNVRGSVHVSIDGELSIGPRHAFPTKPERDLLQAGPTLVANGVSLMATPDPEGFSSAAHQFDSDITCGRYPRAAIGTSDKYIWSVACDGRTEGDAGMTLAELADTMLVLGVKAALNLDGGSSASLISGGELRNRPRGNGISFPSGRPIHTAIIFQ